MKKSMRKGFTLVELLIVIVVIGILSAMMMLSSTEAVSSARAADIISDLRNLKTAALAMYADNIDAIELGNISLPKSNKAFDGTNKLNDVSEDIFAYLGNEGVKGKYSFAGTRTNEVGKRGAPKDWYVLCKVDDNKVKDKLKSRASSVGLFGSDNATTAPNTNYTNQDYVAMPIR